jgi:hypothetical protein
MLHSLKIVERVINQRNFNGGIVKSVQSVFFIMDIFSLGGPFPSKNAKYKFVITIRSTT